MRLTVTNRTRLPIALTLVAAVAVAATVAAVGYADPSSDLVTYSSLGQVHPQATPVGSTPASVLSAVVAQVNDASVVSATLGHPPVGVHETDDPSVPNTSEFNNSLWLYVTVKANGMTPAETTEPIWLGNLITGALRDKLYANSEPDLRSSTVAVNLPDGTTILSAGGGVGSVTQGQMFSSTSDSDINAHIRSAAAAAGLTVDSLRIIHADQAAPAVVVSTSRPAAAASNPDALLTSLFGPPGTYEGEYAKVLASDGTVVFVQGSSFRTGVGQRWVNPVYGGGDDAPPATPPSG